MPEMQHSHYFRGVTSFNNGHTHSYAGRTTYSPDIPGHRHFMSGYTTFNNGHTHFFAVSTGPAIETGRGHYHRYRGVTRVADRHVHYFSGFTSIFAG